MKRKLLMFLACLLALTCLLTSCNMTVATDDDDEEEEEEEDVTTTKDDNSSVTTTDPTNDGPGVTTTEPPVTTDPNPVITTTKKPFVKQTTKGEPDPEDMPHDEQLLLGGVNITSYRIVYENSPLDNKIGSATGKTIGEDIGEYLQGTNKACDFDYQSAVRLQTLIKEKFGYDIEIVDSSAVSKDIKRYEILVGSTNRTSTYRMTQGIAENEFVCAFNDVVASLPNHYVICGGTYGATWHAIDGLEEYIEQELEKDPDATIDIANAGNLSDTYDLKTIACLGDSITRGSQALPDGGNYGSPDGVLASFGTSTVKSAYLEQYLSYPATLQRELWKDYIVINYGRGWASMIDKFPGASDEGPYYYNDTTQFANCLKKSNEEEFEFDLVLIMLGTNDAGGLYGGASKWGPTQQAEFLAEAKNLVDKVKEGSPNATFVFMNAPHRCDGNSENKNDTAMRTLQKSVATELKTQGYNVYHYDMEAYTIENLSATGGVCGTTGESEIAAHTGYYNVVPELSAAEGGKADTTHPNYRGYGLIAEGMADLAAYLLEGAEAPKYMIDIG